MSEPESPFSVNLSVDPRQGEPPASITRDTPFSILVLGDFSARGLGGIARRPLDWRPVRVTPDNLPDLAGFTTRLPLVVPHSGDSVELSVDSLHAFHPDELMRRIPLLVELREERRRVAGGEPLSDRGRSLIGLEAGSEAVSQQPAQPAPSEEEVRSDPPSLEGLLDAIVGGESAPQPASRAARSEIRDFAKEVVRSHLLSEPDVRAGDLEVVDGAIAGLLRGVLRQRPFKDLESLWRGLVLLLSWVDTTQKVRVYVVDASKAELEAELGGSGARLRRLFANPDLGPAVPRWGLVVGAYGFGGGTSDLGALEAIGRVASSFDVPWLSEALPEFVGSPGYEALADPDEWSPVDVDVSARLRGSEGTPWVGLAMPGVQAREPYGGEGLRCRVPGFEEAPDDAEDLLWANPAFAWAALLGRRFASRGWSMTEATDLDIDQVPMGWTSERQPLGPTRARLTVDSARTMSRLGVVPMIGFPHEARVRMGGERSLAVEGTPPRAWWRIPDR
jgi:hypothetical protein